MVAKRVSGGLNSQVCGIDVTRESLLKLNTVQYTHAMEGSCKLQMFG